MRGRDDRRLENLTALHRTFTSDGFMETMRDQLVFRLLVKFTLTECKITKEEIAQRYPKTSADRIADFAYNAEATHPSDVRLRADFFRMGVRPLVEAEMRALISA